MSEGAEAGRRAWLLKALADAPPEVQRRVWKELSPGDHRAFERAVDYNRLRPEDVAALEAEARTLALAAMRHLNSLALERQQAARGDPAARERFRFGAFFHPEAEPVGPGPDPAFPAEAPPGSSKEPP